MHHTNLAERLPEVVRQERVQYRIDARVRVRQRVRNDLNSHRQRRICVLVKRLGHQNYL